MTDQILDELHRIREEALVEAGFDYHVFCERLRERERLSKRVIEPPPRVPSGKAAPDGQEDDRSIGEEILEGLREIKRVNAGVRKLEP